MSNEMKAKAECPIDEATRNRISALMEGMKDLKTHHVILLLEKCLTEQKALLKSQEKPKKVKDPNAPKKPVRGYMLYCQQSRPAVRAEHPDLKATEIVSKIAEHWRALSQEEKDKYK